MCERKKTMSVSGYTIRAENLADFFEILVKKGPLPQKKWQQMFYGTRDESWIL